MGLRDLVNEKKEIKQAIQKNNLTNLLINHNFKVVKQESSFKTRNNNLKSKNRKIVIKKDQIVISAKWGTNKSLVLSSYPNNKRKELDYIEN